MRNLISITTGKPPQAGSIALLIDGNNLAHFLYTNLTPGQKMTPQNSQRLIGHLGDYGRTFQDTLRIELYLDRSPGDFPPLPPNMNVFFAEYPQTADDLLLGRFWFHHYNQQPCIVITNDEAILEEVGEAGGTLLRVYDFVRRPGLVTPVFRAPDELPPISTQDPIPADRPISLSASLYFRIVQAKEAAAQVRKPVKPAVRPQPPKQPAPQPIETVTKISEPLPPTHREPAEIKTCSTEAPVGDALKSPAPMQAESGLFYFLSLDTWPTGEGIRFLMNAFCPQHREEHADWLRLFEPTDQLCPADLRGLAEFLLLTCGNEADFARRGSLMDRIRLALLQAQGGPLTLDELADKTGLKVQGLQGRIKQKAGKWVEILKL